MSSVIPPRDGDATPRSPLADEEALRRAFIAEFSALSKEARDDLGADAAVLGPKVVEGAFVRAWDARAQLRTPAQLHEFLVQDVHHASARALSRRQAAHRFAAGGTTPAHDEAHIVARAIAEADLEQSWGRVMHALHGEAHSPETLTEAANASRHEAAVHIAEATKETSLAMPLAIAAAALVIAVGIGAYVDRAGADARIATALSAPDVRVHTTLASQVGVVSLDDGSTVRLAPESKLAIPTSFGPRVRAVKLDGAANFAVAKGEGQFQVHTRDAVIVATGTAFSVRSYPGDGATVVTVSEGTVEVRHGDVRTPLTAGHALVVAPGAPPRPATSAEQAEADGWRAGSYSVAGRPLREVLPELHRWYGLTIVAAQPALMNRLVTLRASLDSSRQAIRGVEQSAGVRFGYAGQNMVFRDTAAAP